MKLRAIITHIVSITSHLRECASPGYSYPISTTRRTGKAAERRKSKQRRRARL